MSELGEIKKWPSIRRVVEEGQKPQRIHNIGEAHPNHPSQRRPRPSAPESSPTTQPPKAPQR